MSSGRKAISRREFLSRGSKIAGGIVATGALTTLGTGKVIGANERINVACIGIRSRGNGHIGGFGKIPGVKIAALCDIDESILNKRASEVEKNFGNKPKTAYDLRKIFDMKDIDAVTIAAPNHWHALATIWACQAGKHVYVE